MFWEKLIQWQFSCKRKIFSKRKFHTRNTEIEHFTFINNIFRMLTCTHNLQWIYIGIYIFDIILWSISYKAEENVRKSISKSISTSNSMFSFFSFHSIKMWTILLKKFNLMNESYWNSIIILYAQCRTSNHAYLSKFDIVILFHFIESKNK